jgi:valyl-tRNA synthetase
MLGDTAVAVHPDDERYRGLVGRRVLLPLVDREIPIVADEAVDPDFGTGAVKVTPAHDPTDFEIAERAGLPAVTIFDDSAVVTEAGGRFADLDRYAARSAVKEALAAEGLLLGIDEHRHAVGHCYRCKTAVEPLLSEQWFVKVRPLVEPAIEAVRSGAVRFIPSRWENSYFHWMENLRDWTISRQIWWGHRIPAWYCDECEELIVAMEDPTECSCGSTSLQQDPDVLDTWFSSALWPFSTLGWPERTDDLDRFYPNSVMVTGFDIIYFWVARMIKMGIHFLDEPPYPDVVIHGLIRAPDGRKMSKSLGNALDPLDIVDEHGSDALRLALIQAAAPGQDVPFQPEWVEAARRFGNKLWNAIRFALPHLEGTDVPAAGGYPEDPGPEERWILSRLGEVTRRVDELFAEYRFSDAYGLLYTFAWSEVFDWYLELSKARLREEPAATTASTVGVVLRDLLKLFHPVIPFLTEELWEHLVGDGLVAGSDWPQPPSYDPPEHFETFRELVTGIRRFRAEHGLGPRHPLDVIVADPDGVAAGWWATQIEALAAVSPQWRREPGEREGRTRLVAGSVQAFIALEGIVDIDAERDRLSRAITAAAADLERSRRKLANPQFLERAPAAVVDKEQSKAAQTEERLGKLQSQLDELG